MSRVLRLRELTVNDVLWVDTGEALMRAISAIEQCEFIGIDCECTLNPYKVSIIQIASESIIFIVDLIKLCYEAPEVVDRCFSLIFQSTRTLKLGYNIMCDISMLIRSYDLNCFKEYNGLLDFERVFRDTKGGLSGLTEKILGARLNKSTRDTDWRKRPLSNFQLEYAALDSVVLVHIFKTIKEQNSSNADWRSQIINHWDYLTSKSGRRNNKLK